MSHVFGKILEMSAVAGITIVVVLLARLALSKAPKKYSYLLWSVAAFRLVCPVSLRSNFSLLRIFERAGKTTEYIPADRLPVSSGINVPVTPIESAPPSVTVPPTMVGTAVSAAPEVSLMTILTAIWCIGIAAMLIFAAVNYIKIVRRFSNAVLMKDNIWQSDKVRSPLIVGIVKPKIYVPFGLSEDTLHYALAHECCHLRRLDHVVRPLAYLILAIHWFNPLCWLAYFLMISDMEISCDEAVLAKEKDSGRAYSATLLSFAVNKRFPLPNPVDFSGADVKKRIEHILKWKKPGIFVGIVAGLLCAAVLVGCGADPKPPEEQQIPQLTVSCELGEVPAKWYADGQFDFEYDELNVLTVNKDSSLTFKPDFAVDTLSVGEDLYLNTGGATTIQQRTIDLERTENGEFLLEPDGIVSAEQAVYFIPYNHGKFVVKILFVDDATVPEENISIGPYSYTLPRYYGTTELDAKIWEHMQMPESGGLQRYQVPSLVCSERGVAKLWQFGILDENEFSNFYGLHITDTAGLFIALNIRGWETIYDGVIDRYIDEVGPELFTDEVTYDITLSMERLMLQFISGTDICGYKFFDEETGRPIEAGVARISEGAAEAILEFVSPGMSRANYVELPYTLGFTDNEATYYSGPGGGVAVNTVAANYIVGVEKAAEVDGELWLRIVDYDYKLPGYLYGWLPASELREYTEELSGAVDSPIILPKGTEYFSCAAVEEIPDTEAETARYERKGVIYTRAGDYYLLGITGGEEIWVRAEYIRPYVELLKYR